MKEISQVPHEMTAQQAIERILVMRHELQVRGNIDDEHALIENIIERMRDGQISPQDAVNRVHDIMQSRNDR